MNNARRLFVLGALLLVMAGIYVGTSFDGLFLGLGLLLIVGSIHAFLGGLRNE